MTGLISRLFPARSELLRDRDRWAKLAGELAAQNQCQKQNVAEGMRLVEELRAEAKRLSQELEQMRASAVTISAGRCRCGRFAMDAFPNGLMLMGGTCGRDTYHTPTSCEPPIRPVAP